MEDELWQIHNEIKAIYEGASYPVYEVSALTGMGIDRIKQLIEGKVCLFSGHSGVGKSALLNAIDPSLHLTGRSKASIPPLLPRYSPYDWKRKAEIWERRTESGERRTETFHNSQFTIHPLHT